MVKRGDDLLRKYIIGGRYIDQVLKEQGTFQTRDAYHRRCSRGARMTSASCLTLIQLSDANQQRSGNMERVTEVLVKDTSGLVEFLS